MKAVYLCLCMLAAFCFPAAALPADCSQVIVGSADGWNSSHVQLSLLEKGPRGWVMVKGPFPARLGKSGLVWGRGISLPPAGGPVKKEVVERGNTVRFVMYEKAAVNPAKIPELLSKYDHALKFIPDQKGPYFVLNRGTNSRTVSGSSINYIRQFVLDVQTILVEKTIKKDA